MTERNPLPVCLSHLAVLERSAEVSALKEAALWVSGCLLTMQSDSVEAAWARGAAQYIWQLADERDGIAPWRSDMYVAVASRKPVIVGKRGSNMMAMAIYSGEMWRHADSLEPVCFGVEVWQPCPTAPL